MAVDSFALERFSRALIPRYLAALSYCAFFGRLSLSTTLLGVWVLIIVGGIVGFNCMTAKLRMEQDRNTGTRVAGVGHPKTRLTLKSLRVQFSRIMILLSSVLFSSLIFVWMGAPILLSGIRVLSAETLVRFICGFLTFELVLSSVLDIAWIVKSYRGRRDLVSTHKTQDWESVDGEKEE